jgi:hypothetical protein
VALPGWGWNTSNPCPVQAYLVPAVLGLAAGAGLGVHLGGWWSGEHADVSGALIGSAIGTGVMLGGLWLLTASTSTSGWT